MSDIQIRSTGTTEVIHSSDSRATCCGLGTWLPRRCNWRWQEATGGWPCGSAAM